MMLVGNEPDRLFSFATSPGGGFYFDIVKEATEEYPLINSGRSCGLRKRRNGVGI